MACELFGYERDEFIGQKLKDLIKLKHRHQKTTKESHLDETTGEVLSLSGNVVSYTHKELLLLNYSGSKCFTKVFF